MENVEFIEIAKLWSCVKKILCLQRLAFLPLAIAKMPQLLIERCRELGITIKHLDKIDREDIGILIPDDQLGVRILLKNKLKNWIKAQQENPSNTIISTNHWINENLNTLDSLQTTSAALNCEPSCFKTQELDVKQLLLNTSLGVELINFYKKHNNLHPKHQDVLAN